jgi:hypothetical protein
VTGGGAGRGADFGKLLSTGEIDCGSEREWQFGCEVAAGFRRMREAMSVD